MDDETFDVLLKTALEMSIETEMDEYPSIEELKKVYPAPDDRKIQLILEAALTKRKTRRYRARRQRHT